mgnify:CR=1 FL=1
MSARKELQQAEKLLNVLKDSEDMDNEEALMMSCIVMHDEIKKTSTGEYTLLTGFLGTVFFKDSSIQLIFLQIIPILLDQLLPQLHRCRTH